MPDDENPQLAAIGAALAEDRRVRAAITGQELSPSALLGFAFGPGDLVLDTVTGLTGTILHARTETHLRRAARA